MIASQTPWQVVRFSTKACLARPCAVLIPAPRMLVQTRMMRVQTSRWVEARPWILRCSCALALQGQDHDQSPRRAATTGQATDGGSKRWVLGGVIPWAATDGKALEWVWTNGNLACSSGRHIYQTVHFGNWSRLSVSGFCRAIMAVLAPQPRRQVAFE